MAVYSERTRTITYTEFIIPRNSPAAEFDKAWLEAQNSWAENHGHAGKTLTEVSFPDHWANIDADDEYVIIRITREQVTPA